MKGKIRIGLMGLGVLLGAKAWGWNHETHDTLAKEAILYMLRSSDSTTSSILEGRSMTRSIQSRPIARG